ncbi:uncharacterized protein LOC143219715 [Lasioglossum baleicum]|uniref:uncharacterized protein LOC143219715 n=1 Tax=Lasioglossum baleicum TaxID=434251 RepID=UPI003FCE74F2
MASRDTALKSFKRVRTTIKGQITRVQTYVLETQDLSIYDLEARIAKVKELVVAYEDVQANIENLDEESDHVSERDSFERSAFALQALLASHADRLRGVREATLPSRQASTSIESTNCKPANKMLPKIQIPSFDGNLINWFSFYDTFKSLVHENVDLPNVQKFHYLKNSLRGEISSIVASLNASSENYLVAWDMLQKRCNRPRQLIQAHLKQLFDLPEIIRDTPANLRKLAEQAQVHVNALKGLNQPINSWDQILIFIIVKKVDKTTRRAWERKLENDELPTFQRFIDFINTQARGEEWESEKSNSPSDNDTSRVKSKRSFSHLTTNKSVSCVICQDEHYVFACPKFLAMEVKDRLKSAQKSKLCLNCLKVGHNTVSVQRASEDSKDTQVETDVTCKALMAVNNSEVLLGTAQITIYDNNNKRHTCRVLVDGGSQSNYMTESLANLLQLKKERVNISSSGLNNQIAKFWEVEELPKRIFLSDEEATCEEHYKQNTRRDQSGRYIVRLPFNEKRSLLGDSHKLALKRFYTLENKLIKNTVLYEQYKDFLAEYESLNHMSEVSADDHNSGFYLPHHAVIKASSATTKVRVVFDASAKSSSGVSLNDTLLVGPTIQNTLFTTLIKFRTHICVLTADIEKMFRQVKVHEEDSYYQKILWRQSVEHPLKTYKLNTVTYGTACAPFLAIRCLKQLAEDDAKGFPLAARAFDQDFYVDDLLTGASDFNSALKLRNELIELAKLGGFNLRQWVSNDKNLVNDLDNNQENKSLGPVIIQAKIIMQELWKTHCEWDEVVPQSIYYSWIRFRDQLRVLNQFSIRRPLLIKNHTDCQLHGFCDATTLLSKLVSEVMEALTQIKFSKIRLWTDSTIVLHWIKTSPHLLKTFVANRVSDLQASTDARDWFHVPTLDNPADYISRGQDPQHFLNNITWTSGPHWLSKEENCWPNLLLETIDIPEKRNLVSLVTVNEPNSILLNMSMNVTGMLGCMQP